MKDVTNDNEVRAGALRGPDAHGQAAMLLVESLIHMLVARKQIGLEDAIEVVEIAIDVKTEIAADLGDSHATLQKSLTLLKAVGQSLRADWDGGSA